jgi:4a-hydroxytetrahydrobiopterin dehydratase
VGSLAASGVTDKLLYRRGAQATDAAPGRCGRWDQALGPARGDRLSSRGPALEAAAGDGSFRRVRQTTPETIMNRAKLNDSQITDALSALNASATSPWTVVDGKLHKEFQFRDFSEAFCFMARSALAAEAMDHHPEWFNVYRTVRVDLATHDAGGITELDFALAGRMESVAG